MTAAVNIIGTDLKTGTNIVTLTGYDPTHLIRFSKPAAASSGGLLLYDAQSYWPTDAGDVPTASPVPGQTWDNTLSIYGNNGAADILLFQASGMGSPYFATEAAAFAALAAQLPVNLTGYATYKVVGLDDPHPPDNRGGLSVLVEDLGPLVGAPELDALAGGRRIGIVVRIASSPDPIRLWSGQVRDLAVPAGGPETTDGAIYQSHGMLGELPQFVAALNGDAQRLELAVSGTAISGEIAALATDSAEEIRDVAVDVGLILFDEEWQLVGSTFWLWSGLADSLTVERSGGGEKPIRTLKLSVANIFSGRRRANLSFFTDIDQRRRAADDNFFDQVAKLYAGTTKVWGIQ